MSSINNVGNTNPVQNIVNNPIQKSIPAGAAQQQPAVDRLDLSGVGYLQTLKTNDIRTDKVATVKAQIAAGTYEDDNKLNVAIDGVLDDILK
ncbi:MAG TPA: flagellar biosynthesis anti-sigma factor FlgM [Tepidisphaeraceae bacterium]|nr:flagellar biosynthesis anti-sigma factor FlgM [Tepidisphaeraceae bacterium]